MTMTTIKVPTELRDRLAARAKREHVTLAAVIANALDEAEERQFWDAVREENARLTPEEREEYLQNGTLLDDLEDPEDKAISIRGGW
jgi:predicted transcriptional regulator